jgi:TonB family protein
MREKMLRLAVVAAVLARSISGSAYFDQQQVPCSVALANEAKASGWNLDFGPGVYRSCDPGITPPKATKSVKPAYTAKAMVQKIQGAVIVGAVIDADGRVREARVLKSLDPTFGLDENAIKAVKESKFRPALLIGTPVRSFAIFELYFSCCGG